MPKTLTESFQHWKEGRFLGIYLSLRLNVWVASRRPKHLLTSLSFVPLIGMHVFLTWDEQFGRQRIRFRRTFSISEYPVPGTPNILLKSAYS